MRRLSIILICALILMAISFSANASVINFSPIRSYSHTGDENIDNSYSLNRQYISVPDKGGIVSNLPLNLNIGSKIEVSLKSSIDITKDTKDRKWVQKFRLYLLSKRPVRTLKSVEDNSPENIEDDGYIKFVICPKSVQDPNYSKSKENKIETNQRSIWEAKHVYHTPLKWNKITINVINKKLIKVFVNDGEALIYKGDFPQKAYLGIGQNLAVDFYIGREMRLNGNSKTIDLNF